MMQRLSHKVRVEKMPSIRVRPTLAVEMKQRFLQQDYVTESLQNRKVNDGRNIIETFPRARRFEYHQPIERPDTKVRKASTKAKNGTEDSSLEDMSVLNERVMTAMSKRKCKELGSHERQVNMFKKCCAEIQ